MNILKATGTIGGLTLLSRIAGFARDMMLARILGAGLAADAFQVAFRVPNTFRRLFAEGAFSAAYVPMFSRKLHGPGGLEEAQTFSQDVLSLFVPVLILFTALFELIMPAFIGIMAEGYRNDPTKFAFAVELSRIAFPYLLFISVVALLTGILNSMSRFAAGAAAPILLNLALISALLIGMAMTRDGEDQMLVARLLSGAVAIAGLLQLLWLWWWTRRVGFRLHIRKPRLTPDVRQLGRVFLPATFGAGIYQLSQLIDTFFASQLAEGSLTFLSMADRLNQMPLGVIGIALGTAILPALSRHIVSGEQAAASKLQSDAIELALLLTLPAAVALAICAWPFVSVFFVGGKFSAANGRITADVLSALVAGLPAYVTVKLLTPAYFARSDTRTPVYTACVVLVFNVILNILLISRYGIVGLAGITAFCAWLNCALLYAVLHRRGHYVLPVPLIGRVARQVVATLIMAAALVALRGVLDPWLVQSTGRKLMAVMVLVAVGGLVYAGAALATGAVDRARVALLLQRRKR